MAPVLSCLVGRVRARSQFRGSCLVVSNRTCIAGLAALPLAEASAIFYLAPVLLTALSALLLRERVPTRDLGALQPIRAKRQPVVRAREHGV